MSCTCTSEVFAKNTIGEVVQFKRPLAYVTTKATIAEATKKMRELNVLSLPIYSDEEKRFVGIVDTVSIMFFLAFGKFRVELERVNDVVFDAKLAYAEQPVVDLLVAHEEAALGWTLDSKATLDKALEPFCKGIHRAIVTTESDDLSTCKILSQSDVVRYIADHSADLAGVLNKSLVDLNLAADVATKKLFTITEAQTALDGFRLMYINQVQAVGVVDILDGRLVSNLSASDIRGVNAGNVREVQRPVMGFLASQHGQTYYPVTASPRSTLLEIVLKMTAAKVHRIWIVDSSQKPVAVVTMTDVIRKFFEKKA